MMSRGRKHGTRIDHWADAPGHSRPTPERLARGGFRLVDTESAGKRFCYDDDSTPIRHAHNRGQITDGQRDAAERFERLVRAVSGSPGPRSCLDWSPRATASDSATEAQVQAWREYKDVCLALGMTRTSILQDVCHRHEGTGDRRPNRRRWRLLCEGLDVLCVFWKIENKAG